MVTSFLTFRRFNTQAEATALRDFLKSRGIVSEIENNSPTFDVTFAGNDFQHQFNVKISPQDFEKAQKMLEEQADVDLATLDPDYYLLSFSNEELYDIVTTPDEWSAIDYMLARKILASRGKEINEEVMEALKRQRIRTLAKPEERQTSWIAAGYVMALLGGFIAVFIGWYLMSHKKTLPNGERIYAYQLQDRNHGFYILLLGSAMLIFYLFMQTFARY